VNSSVAGPSCARPLVRADLTALIARHRLDPTDEPITATPLVDAEWTAVLREVETSRITGSLINAIVDGVLAVTDEQLNQAEELHERSMLLAVCLERTLLDIDDVFGDRHIPFRVLKGPALAHTVYGDPADRSFGDVDVLVRTPDLAAAVQALEDASSCRRLFAALRPGFVGRFGKSVTLGTPEGLEIDMHRTLAPGPYGVVIHPEELFAGSSPFTLGGREVLGLAPAYRFLHACFAAAIGSATPRLLSLRDVAQLALHTDFDVSEILATASRWKAEAVLARAMRQTWDVLHLTAAHPLAEWASRYEPSRRDRCWLDVYIGEERSFAAQALAAFWVLPFGDKLSYASSLLLPGREFMATRKGGYARRLGSIVRFSARQAVGKVRE
jgi:hypothetical protein